MRCAIERPLAADEPGLLRAVHEHVPLHFDEDDGLVGAHQAQQVRREEGAGDAERERDRETQHDALGGGPRRSVDVLLVSDGSLAAALCSCIDGFTLYP